MPHPRIAVATNHKAVPLAFELVADDPFGEVGGPMSHLAKEAYLSPRSQNIPLASNPPSPLQVGLMSRSGVTFNESEVPKDSTLICKDSMQAPQFTVGQDDPNRKGSAINFEVMERSFQADFASGIQNPKVKSNFPGKRPPRYGADSLLSVHFPSQPSASSSPRPARIPIAAHPFSATTSGRANPRLHIVDDETLFCLIQKEYRRRRGIWRQALSLRGFQRLKISYGGDGLWKEGALEDLMAQPDRGRGKQDVVSWIRKVDSTISSERMAQETGMVGEPMAGTPALEIVEGWRIGRIVVLWILILLMSIAAGCLWIFVPIIDDGEQAFGLRGRVVARITTGLLITQAGIFVGATVAGGCAVLSWLIG
ncbi:MAG: hypothetical protein M4579_000788 [Chaenotheca gracillima]|nr:MAG: hypothetical protein M4579_000788 [Chaenotheca gracillima]